VQVFGRGGSVVWAMNPGNQTEVIPLVCHPQTVTKIGQAGLKAKIGEFWGLVHGNPPANPDPDAPQIEIGHCLRRPVAIFKGLKRPLHFEHMAADRDMLIYVTNPRATFRYQDHVRFEGILVAEAPPIESVFTTFVSLNPAHVDAARATMSEVPPTAGAEKPTGVITFWEWTDHSPAERHLPYAHLTRYGTRIL
jgi:hypothetical protein